MKRKFHDFLTLLTSTEKMLTRAVFELAPSGTPVFAALPVCRSTELSSHWERCAHLMQFKCTRYSRDNLTLSMRICCVSIQNHPQRNMKRKFKIVFHCFWFFPPSIVKEHGGKSLTSEGNRVAVIEKSSGRVIAGMAAPVMNNLTEWIVKNPSFQVLVAGKCLPWSDVGCEVTAGDFQ